MGKHGQYGGVVTSPRCSKKVVAIVGAGPAGLMAAEVVARAGHAVTVYERMPSPARKFLLAGRGGLNLTHSEPLAQFVTRYGNEAAAVVDCISAFPPQDLVAWANALGEETFIGSSGRVFPKAMKASPLLRAWLRRLDTLGVTIKTRHTWKGFSRDGGLMISNSNGVVMDLEPDAVVLALGGASWPRLGSDGGWLEVLKSQGVPVTPLQAANSGIAIAWSAIFAERFAGQPLKRIAVTVGASQARGEAVITGSGLEGGAIYAVGRAIRTALSEAAAATVTIDLKPDTSIEELTARLSRPRGSQSQTNFMRKATNLDAVALGLMREAGPLPTDAAELAARIKAVRLTVTGLASVDRAISTAGGVTFGALSPELMIKTKPGVFVAGEMLDWDAPTGGYLLQASFATGVVAANGVLNWLDATFS